MAREPLPMNRPVRLLLVSFTLPQVGGLETMIRLIAREFVRLAEVEIRIVTPTAGEWDPQLPGVTVHRQLSLMQLHSHYQWADAVFFNHFYLKFALPLFWMPSKPAVLSISGYTPPAQVEHWKHRWMGRLMLALLYRAHAVIACNAWCRDLLPVESTIVRNPYDEERFALHPVEGARPGDVLFAGRITWSKGCEELIEAFAEILGPSPADDSPRLTLVGDGELREVLIARAASLGIARWVTFTGPMDGEGVVREMRRHRILVVPSRYQEPVGIVALEGIASGCVVVGSEGGGLSETIGPYGFTFPNRDVPGLIRALKAALALSPAERAERLQGRELYLKPYRAGEVARGYLKVVSGVLPPDLRMSFPALFAGPPSSLH
jgi:glycogen(starch) synthase